MKVVVNKENILSRNYYRFVACLFVSVLFFFFSKLHQSTSSFWKILSECQTVWIQIRPDILSGLIWVQTVCKGYHQLTTLVGKETFNNTCTDISTPTSISENCRLISYIWQSDNYRMSLFISLNHSQLTGVTRCKQGIVYLWAWGDGLLILINII